MPLSPWTVEMNGSAIQGRLAFSRAALRSTLTPSVPVTLPLPSVAHSETGQSPDNPAATRSTLTPSVTDTLPLRSASPHTCALLWDAINPTMVMQAATDLHRV